MATVLCTRQAVMIGICLRGTGCRLIPTDAR